jgi:hypothetical protein
MGCGILVTTYNMITHSQKVFYLPAAISLILPF